MDEGASSIRSAMGGQKRLAAGHIFSVAKDASGVVAKFEWGELSNPKSVEFYV